MTKTDWLMLMMLAVGWMQGLYVGWALWRRPHLKYKTEDEE